jgi:urease accessory protein UreF
MRQFLYKSYVSVYRVVAMFALYGMLMGIAAYATTMAFYALNSNWIAPITISPSNDKILAMTQQVVSSQQALDTLSLQTKSLELSLREMLSRRVTLQHLATELDQVLQTERAANTDMGQNLKALAGRKQDDIAKTQELLGNIERQRADIEHNLSVGLITKSEAMAQEQSLAQFQNTLTDNQIGAVMLQDNVRQKLTRDLSAVDSITKTVELQSEIQQLDVQIATTQAQVKNNALEAGKIAHALKVAHDSPYLVASESTRPVDFAFVSYDNPVNEGEAVLDCRLSFVVCHQVGTVTRVFGEEEQATHPIFRSPIRGYMVQLSLNDPWAAKSKTLFVGNAPLGI